MKRRNFLKLNMAFSSLYLSQYLVSCSSSRDNDKIISSDKKILKTTSLSKRPKSGSFDIAVDGQIPSDFQGTLYRNGPAIFERNGVRKNHILDGDGFVTKLDIRDGHATFMGEFVQTAKFKEEEGAGEFLYDSFDFTNLSNSLGVFESGNNFNQSSVSIKHIGDKLYSFDEASIPHILDKDSLNATLAPDPFEALRTHSAHGKIDPKNGDFVNFGIQYGDPDAVGAHGLKNYLHIHIIKNEKIKFYKKISINGIVSKDKLKGVYFHDFFVTDNYIIFHLQPVLVDIKTINPINELFGIEETSLAGSYSWDGSLKNKIMIVNRHNPNIDEIIVDTPITKAFFHSCNSYEEGNKIILDFIAYDTFNFFDKNSSDVANIIEGRINFNEIDNSPAYPTRHIIELLDMSEQTGAYTNAKFVSQEIFDTRFTCEFPTINRAYQSRKNQFFYSSIEKEDYLLNGIGRFNNELKKWDKTYLFSSDYTCGEPVFCPRDNATSEDDGYVMSTVHNLEKELTFIAIFDSKTIDKGMIATIHLKTSLPFRLHGEWVGSEASKNDTK